MTVSDEIRAELMAQFIEDTRKRIEEQKWVVMNIFPTDEAPGMMFHYTVGLTGYGLPELEMMGLGHETAGSILNMFAIQMLDRAEIRPGRMQNALSDGTYDAYFIEADNLRHDDYPAAMARRLYGDGVRLLQCVWPD